MKIGIGYTVHNRPKIALKALQELAKFMPPDAKLVVIDDASTEPFPKATFRFEQNMGIAHAKNRCLALLDDCEHIFLFDEDTWPKADHWWVPYIENKEPHLMFTFDRLKDGRQNGNKIVLSKNGLVSYSNPCGCMLYLERRVLDVVGGMDINFGKYAWEHVSWSRRIYNAGLTSAPFLDIPNSLDLFHSMDWAGEVVSSVTENRAILIRQSTNYYRTQMKSKAYCPYKPMLNFLLTAQITTLLDTQRGIKWEFYPDAGKDLFDSLNGSCIIKNFTDHLWYEHRHSGNSDWHYAKPQHDNPYFAVWFIYRDYLRNIDPHCMVWITDLTDVKMLRDPFPHMKRNTLYVGDEAGQNTGNLWLRRHHPHAKFYRLFKARLPLLNAGLLGGTVGIVLEFCERICELAGLENQHTEMAAFNQVAYEFFKNRMYHGPQVNTIFKAWADNGQAWFQHK